MLRHNSQLMKELHLTSQFVRGDTGPRMFIYFTHEFIFSWSRRGQNIHICKWWANQYSARYWRISRAWAISNRFSNILSAIHHSWCISSLRCFIRLCCTHRKHAEIYNRRIDEIFNIAPRWSPHAIMIDFKQASISAFPNVLLSECYCHSK